MKKIISWILLTVIVVSSFTLSSSAMSWNSVNGYGQKTIDCDNKFIYVRDTVYNKLSSELNLNHAAICGILGNIYCECGFDYTLVGTDKAGTKYKGLCMWCEKYFNINELQTLDQQVNFLCSSLKDMKTTYQKLLNLPNTELGAVEAENIFRLNYERCGTQQKERRQTAAKIYFYNLKNSPSELPVFASEKTVKKTVNTPKTATQNITPNTTNSSQTFQQVKNEGNNKENLNIETANEEVIIIIMLLLTQIIFSLQIAE